MSSPSLPDDCAHPYMLKQIILTGLYIKKDQATTIEHLEQAETQCGKEMAPAMPFCCVMTEAAAEASLEPTAMPTSAAASAARSLMPSPQYMATLPKPYMKETTC